MNNFHFVDLNVSRVTPQRGHNKVVNRWDGFENILEHV